MKLEFRRPSNPMEFLTLMVTTFPTWWIPCRRWNMRVTWHWLPGDLGSLVFESFMSKDTKKNQSEIWLNELRLQTSYRDNSHLSILIFIKAHWKPLILFLNPKLTIKRHGFNGKNRIKGKWHVDGLDLIK